MKKIVYYESPIGTLGIVEEDNKIIELILNCNEKLSGYDESESECLKEAVKQLAQYFEGSRKEFELELNPQGTDFQQKVWRALCDIPYGETVSYKHIAEQIGNNKAARAVGMANNKNPISIFIPCHRVIGGNGKLVGYGGGLNIKEYLLELENRNK